MDCDSRIDLLFLSISHIQTVVLHVCIYNAYATKRENDLNFVILWTHLYYLLLWELWITNCSKDKSHSTGNGILRFGMTVTGQHYPAHMWVRVTLEWSPSAGSLFLCIWHWGTPPHIEGEAPRTFRGERNKFQTPNQLNGKENGHFTHTRHQIPAQCVKSVSWCWM